MSTQITTAFVQQFKGNVVHLSQQKGSRLRDAVRSETVNAKYHYFERLGKTAAVLRTTRHGDTPLVESQHSRRRVGLADYEWADLVDRQDKIRLLISPESEYAIAAANAMSRAIDDVIIAAFNASVFEGETGATETTFPAGQQIAAGGTGLTIAKLLSAKELMDESDVDPDEPRYIAATPAKINDLLNTTEVKSSDYNTVKALAMGQLDTFLGWKFIMTNRLAAISGGERKLYAWARQGMGLAIGQEVMTRITERDDKSYATQVYLCMTLGATRIEDEKVIEIACTES